ncbi:hypothetical protein ACIQ6R_16325 [Streptomyces sp. NPDC096048]|uniref:hypothetical protein n=1 Tax=Streptomyces sp. NPDC096048 TaxID=3366072 RepID=UPI00381C0CF3
MSARKKVAGLLWWSVPSGTDEEAKARTNQLLDELAAEVMAERDTQFVAWLLKKSREYPTDPARQEKAADVIARLASKVARGAVRPNNLRTDFFQPGQTYTSGTWTFRCEAISPSPTTGERRALGWTDTPVYDVRHWHPTALDPDDWTHGGWTVTESGEES